DRREFDGIGLFLPPVFLRYQDSSFQITRFERLQSSSVRQIEGQNAFKWGTEW
ncbi:MAG: hypothetical protein EZS28_046835, partial [Streblomastix strix]